ncbi:ornithine carbamoyltransferase [Acidiferrobacter thiooxydans]|uniref:Ornithine carbamoyltransferase n=1 Tax=Acidiferrobacter thiooxydans TaxID=163359 RepID=A0A1C2G1L3_9GAMM|nr:ornithine carbamoyltransferase [Acidiferrobacter thiooxydans]MDA8118642.1 ornithine carbamoyltransferase [Gammaproteobacteria bacterium]MDA8191955.1 ornithine carbamoyltransferase [Gammaproteobacteria bacterium]RCN56594.1 ornithine carbamoyltransferase [Acidiferrobacter thiooxydans]UEN99260.1 ornithine carbamoyltransferase [Acidiferrobacter thiooxydans]
MIRHFLSLMDCTPKELRMLIERAMTLKAILHRREPHEYLRGSSLALIFEKSSTRTRVSFEAGITQLGGNSMFLAPAELQLGRGEPLEDTARVVSRMVDAIVIRTHEHAKLAAFAEHSQVPVINALTDRFHPCQLLADIQTYFEHRGDIAGRTVAWIGDGNNVCQSWINAARQFGFTLRIATPAGYRPNPEILGAAAGSAHLVETPEDAARGADLVVTDTWASMGQESEKEVRMRAFQGYCVTACLMDLAAADALFMHCLPAYRGVEVAGEVIDGPRSVVWDEAENRLHAQKALLEFLLA